MLSHCWGRCWPRRGGRGPSLRCAGLIVGGLRQEWGLLSVRLCRGGHGLPHACRDKLLRGLQQPSSLRTPCPAGTPGWTDRPDCSPRAARRRSHGPGRADRDHAPGSPPGAQTPEDRRCVLAAASVTRPDGGGAHTPSGAEQRERLILPSKGRQQRRNEPQTGRPRQAAGLRASCCAVPLKRPHGQTLGSDTARPRWPGAGRWGRPRAGAGLLGGRGGPTGPEPDGGPSCTSWMCGVSSERELRRGQSGESHHDNPQHWALEGTRAQCVSPPSADLRRLWGHSPYSCQTRTRSS